MGSSEKPLQRLVICADDHVGAEQISSPIDEAFCEAEAFLIANWISTFLIVEPTRPEGERSVRLRIVRVLPLAEDSPDASGSGGIDVDVEGLREVWSTKARDGAETSLQLCEGRFEGEGSHDLDGVGSFLLELMERS